MLQRILPTLLYLITGKPRYKVVNLEWDRNNWVANIFRLWEMICWKKYGVTTESAGVLLQDSYGFIYSRSMRSFTWEHFLVVKETQFRAFLKAIFGKKIVYDYKYSYSFSTLAIILAIINPLSLTFSVPIVMGAIAIDTNTSPMQKSASGTNTLTITYTSSGSDRYALVFGTDVGGTNSASFTATYDGTSMTAVVSATRGPVNTGSMKGYIFGLYNQNTGSVSVVLTRTNSTNWVEGGVISLTGALQQTTPDVVEGFPGDTAGSSKSHSMTTITDNDAVFVWLMNDNGGGFGTPTNLTQLFIGATGGFGNAQIIYKSTTFPYTPAGTLSTSWTQNGTGDWWYMGVGIAPAGGGVTFIPRIMTS